MSWKWEYAFSAEATARMAPAPFLREVEKEADELVRMCEVVRAGRTGAKAGPTAHGGAGYRLPPAVRQ